MYVAVIGFTCGTHSFKSGEPVPKDLPHNPDRLTRGLIKEVKVVKPKETKVVKNEPTSSTIDKRKSKNSAKRNKQSDK